MMAMIFIGGSVLIFSDKEPIQNYPHQQCNAIINNIVMLMVMNDSGCDDNDDNFGCDANDDDFGWRAQSQRWTDCRRGRIDLFVILFHFLSLSSSSLSSSSP